jgi:hypothetical protein
MNIFLILYDVMSGFPFCTESSLPANGSCREQRNVNTKKKAKKRKVTLK